MASFLVGGHEGRTRHRDSSSSTEPSGRVAVPDLEVAVDSATRKKGLLGREGLADGAGLVIAPTNAVHTFFMRFPIDIVFVTQAGRGREGVPGGAGVANGGGVSGLRGRRTGSGRGGVAGIEVGDKVAVRQRQSVDAREFCLIGSRQGRRSVAERTQQLRAN